jgi:hypothetical protein
MKQEREMDESYFNNKLLKFVFNSKENVPFGIFLVNIFIFTLICSIFGIVLAITGGFEPTVVDKMFFSEVDNYSFIEAVIVFSMFVFTMFVSIIEVKLFHKYITKD